LSALAKAAENEGISEFRLAPGHALLAICDTTGMAEGFAATAARLGFITEAADPRLRIVACAGAPACSSGLIHTKEVAAEMAALGALPENGVVHVSGCTKRCAEPASPAFTVLGTPDGASILDETGLELTRVAEREVPAAFQRVLGSRDMGRDIKSASPVRHRTSA
jgi:precorrin-3B synthase